MAPIGTHVCGFFEDDDRRTEILDLFVEEALADGDKCYCLLERPHPTAGEPSAVEHFTTAETYLAGGRFSAEAMLDRLEDLVSRAVHEEGYPGVRAVGEMTWAAGGFPGTDELCRYEFQVNRCEPQHRQVLLCLYDLSRFPESVVDQVLRTHPWVLVAGVVLPNPFFHQSGFKTTC